MNQIIENFQKSEHAIETNEKIKEIINKYGTNDYNPNEGYYEALIKASQIRLSNYVSIYPEIS